jgi:hypothetical protein
MAGALSSSYRTARTHSAAANSTLFAFRCCSTRKLALARASRSTMAYYPGDYQYFADWYSQSLFSFSTSSPLSLSDPYAYTYTPYDPQRYDREDDRQHQHQRQRQRQHRPCPPPSSASTPLPDRYSSPPFVAPRSSSPPPPPAPVENTPSESYLAFSSIPSTTLSSPTRKLVVLDLNGTLLLRSPRPPRTARGQPHLGPAPRRVMPRPYFPALRSYFFAPRTRAWLDVMVWSSAQPHSVDDMIRHTFGNDRERLIAVWARDTLGLPEGHYRAYLSLLPTQFLFFLFFFVLRMIRNTKPVPLECWESVIADFLGFMTFSFISLSVCQTVALNQRPHRSKSANDQRPRKALGCS